MLNSALFLSAAGGWNVEFYFLLLLSSFMQRLKAAEAPAGVRILHF